MEKLEGRTDGQMNTESYTSSLLKVGGTSVAEKVVVHKTS